jgi:zinc protease
MKQWYDDHMSADRIFLVAVGDFTDVNLKASLETTIGELPNLVLGAVPAAPLFGRGAPGRLFSEDNDQSKGTAYLRGDFAAPSPGAPDYMAANLAIKLFSDLLFTVVRDQYGAVYTPSAAIRSFGANYGSIAIYKTAVTDKIKTYIDETVSIFASGRCVSVDPSRPGEEAKFMKIDDAIGVYRQIFANEYFDAVRTNAALAALMIRSMITMGDPSNWVFDVVRIASVTPKDVKTAFSTYILNGSFTWMAVGDPALIARLPIDEFASFK